MSPKTIFAIILIILGVLVLAYQGITYTYKTKEKVVDLGPVQMTAEKTKTFPLPPSLGGIALLGGIVLLAVGKRSG